MYVITKAELGGAQTHLLDIASHFNKENEIKVILGAPGWLTDKLDEEGISYQVLEGLRNTYHPLELIKLISKLRKIIKAEAPDIVHGHSSIAGLISRFATLKTSSKSVFTMHGSPYSEGYSLSHRVLSGTAEFLINIFTDTYMIYVSKRDLLISEKLKIAPLNPNRKSVVYNGVNIPEEPRVSVKKNDLIKVLMIARFDHPKDQETVVKAAYLLRNYNFVFDFIGGGHRKDITEEMAKKLNLKSLNFLGSVNGAKDYIKDYDLFLLISKSEGLPISILEAMSNSLPVIASNVGGIPEVVEHGKNGFLIPVGNAEALAQSLLKFQDSELISRMGLAGYEVCLERFSKEMMLQKIKEIYLSFTSK